MDLIKQLEELALATRLKRLSDRLGADVSRIYKHHGIEFEAKWFLVLEALHQNKSMSVVEISQELQLSHPAIIQFAEQMLGKGLLHTETDTNDARRRLLSLSPKGKELYSQLSPLLEVIKDENRKWIAESGSNLLRTLDKLEASLNKKPMFDRIDKALKEKKGQAGS